MAQELSQELITKNLKDYAIFMLDPKGEIVDWNPGVERVLGYREKEFVGHPGAIVFTPDEREAGAPEREIETATNKGQAMDQRWQLHKDGRRLWMNGILSAIRNDSRERLGFIKIMHDETEGKHVEDERARLLAELESLNNSLERRVAERTAELRSSEERFSTAVQASPVPMFILRREDLQFVEVNENVLQMIGLERDEVVGRTARDLRLFGKAEDGGSSLKALIQRDDVPPSELQVHPQAGETRYALTCGKAIDFGAEPCQLATLIDTTERSRTSEELREAIRAVMQESDWFADMVLGKLAEHRSERVDRVAVADLTKRGRQVLGLMAQGRSNEQIVEELELAKQTVDNDISRLYSKLGVNSRAEAIIWARERGVGS